MIDIFERWDILFKVSRRRIRNNNISMETQSKDEINQLNNIMDVKKVYISALIGGLPEYVVQKAFSNAEKELIEVGYKTINPLKLAEELRAIFEHRYPTDAQYLGFDIYHLIDHSDAVYFCRGWHESKGCRLEFEAAKIYGKELMFE